MQWAAAWLLDGVPSHLSRPVDVVVELQLLTGARPGELVGLRPADRDRPHAGVWACRPATHKDCWCKTEGPFMGPAREKERGKFPELWRGSIRK